MAYKPNWHTLFDGQTDKSPHSLAKVIISNLDGWGIEYGLDDDLDAEILLDGIAALQRYLAEHGVV